MTPIPLSALPTGTRFTFPWPDSGTYIRLEPTAWDTLRSDPSHWLHGVNPQVERRADVVYVIDCERVPGQLVLMHPDTLVEPLPAVVEGLAYRVTVSYPGGRMVYGADELDHVRDLIRCAGMVHAGGINVAIEHAGQHINADGSPCKEQEKGLQFRAVDSRVMIGSISL